MVKFSGLPDPLEPRRLRDRVLPFAILFLVALVLRVGYVWVAAGPHAQPYSDPADYEQIAWNLTVGNGFALGEGLEARPTAFRPPLLPWLLSLVYHLFGRDYFAGLIFFAALGALVPLLVARLGAPLFGGRVGFFAGILAAVNPLLVFFSGYLLTESLFALTLLWAMIASVEWMRGPSGRRALWCGLAWGAATLARPTALLLPLLTIAWAWGPLGLMLEPRTVRRQALIVLAGIALVVGPWTIRNALALGAFVPVTTGLGHALLDSTNPDVWDDPANRGGSGIDRDSEVYRWMLEAPTEVERGARARRAAIEFALSRVHQWPEVAWARFARFWRFESEAAATGAWHGEGSPVARLIRAADPLLLWSILVMPLAAWGAALTLRGARRWFQSYPLWMIAYFTALALVFWGSLRMRVPIEPLVALFAAAGAFDLRARLRRRAT